jgi:FAD/FMN-containing dehydrogenase
MSTLERFVDVVRSEFPDDRVTFQKVVPTFHPESAEEAARLICLANENSQPLFIAGFGNNVSPVGDRFSTAMAIKSDRLNYISEINEKDFYITAGAGYPLREVNRAIHEKQLLLPHSSLPYTGSVGGAIAVGLSADLHGHDFPLRRYLLKAKIVTVRGEIIEPGSVCFKSVSGYDVVKIFAGSWGLLGMVITASFRVMPVSAASDYAPARQKPVDRRKLLDGLLGDERDADVIYSRKIKAKFDPNNVLPVLL